MKFILITISSLFVSGAFAAMDPFEFICDIKGTKIESIKGIKKAPENPVVGLQIKVLKEQVPLFVMKAKFGTVEKDMFVTDWTTPDNISPEGKDLLDLLTLFMDVKTDDLSAIRAGVPTNLLDTFAYLELKHQDNTVTKLGFDGSNPNECK